MSDKQTLDAIKEWETEAPKRDRSRSKVGIEEIVKPEDMEDYTRTLA